MNERAHARNPKRVELTNKSHHLVYHDRENSALPVRRTVGGSARALVECAEAPAASVRDLAVERRHGGRRRVQDPRPLL